MIVEEHLFPFRILLVGIDLTTNDKNINKHFECLLMVLELFDSEISQNSENSENSYDFQK